MGEEYIRKQWQKVIRLFGKATNPTPVIAGTKKWFLDMLEQTFKTKLPCIVVSDGLPTNSELLSEVVI